MDCQAVREVLDAYALGAAERTEAQGLERHVADCVRCWEELSEAQRAAALLSLSVTIEEAPDWLRDRIMAQAEREGRSESRLSGLRRAFKWRWPAVAGAVAVAGVAALAFAAVLQLQLNDLRSDRDELAHQVQDADHALGEQRQLVAVLAAPDLKQVSLPAVAAGSEALGVYYWSRVARKGFLVCNNMPQLKDGQVYQGWYYLTSGDVVSAGTFDYWNGIGQLAMDLSFFQEPPKAIGVSIEEGAGSDLPKGELVLLGALRAP